MENNYVKRLFSHIEKHHPQFLRGVEEARAKSPVDFDFLANQYLEWAAGVLEKDTLKRTVKAYIQFTTEVNLAQAQYEVDGHYKYKSFKEVYQIHYDDDELMNDYLWGVYLTNFLWAHHLEICQFYKNRFLSRIEKSSNLIEIAPGHGGWGVWALKELPQASLSGFDVSSSSIKISSSLAIAAGVDKRVVYNQQNAMDIDPQSTPHCDGLICSFLLEHLEDPNALFGIINQLIKPGGVAFITGALTAAQIDHIYEFKKESELVLMAESNGLRVLESISTNPERLLNKAKYVPRSMALIVQNSRA